MAICSIGLKVVGAGLFVVREALGITLLGYFTHKYCKELIDKFEYYYKKNGEKIRNSYKQAVEFLLSKY